MTELSEEYHNYIQADEWDERRKLRLELDEYTCQHCGITGVPLDVHHLTYERFGHENMADLLSVCRNCHNEIHGKYPVTVAGVCQTCGEFLSIAIEKIIVFGTRWTQYTCENNHIRSYKDD